MTVVDQSPLVERVEVNLVELSELMASKVGSVNPKSFLEEEFELFSIPAFDLGAAEIASGREIGSSKQNVQPGDVLLSKIVPHIRRSWIVTPEQGFRQIASGEWIIFRDARIHGPYLRQVLVSNNFNAQFMQTVAGVGGSLLRARPAHVAKIRIPLPPLSEQRRIAAILDRADHLRTQRRKALTYLNTLTQSIFSDMFGDPISNSSNWPTAKLSTLGKLDRGVSKHRPRNDPRLLNGTHPLIQTGDVANSGGYITRFKTTYSDLGLSQSKIWPIGTLCITIAANIAKTGILKFEACFPDSVVGFTADDSTAVFVQVWMGFLQKILENNAPESAQKNINLAILRNLDVIAPPMELQQIFARRVAGVERLKDHHRTQLAELDNLFASLQHCAFSGQL